MLQIDGEGNDLHGACTIPLLEALSRDLGYVELDRFVDPVAALSMRETSATSVRSSVISAVMAWRSIASTMSCATSRVSHRRARLTAWQSPLHRDRSDRRDWGDPCSPATAAPAARRG